jgi:halocyanin-like protein
MNRRDFLRTAGGTAGAASAVAASGSATAAEDGGGEGSGDGGGGSGATVVPDFGGYLDSANGFGGPESTQDARGQEEVTVEVGAGGDLAYGPAAVWVETGTTVQFEWTNGNHNVVGDGNDLDSGNPVSETGVNYEFTFEEPGIYNYYCTPHQGQGMLGSIAVGAEGDIPTQEVGGAQEPLNPEHMGVPIQAHFVGIATLLGIAVSLVLTFFILKYGESSHTKGGNN